MTILVFGATGTTGGEVARQLIEARQNIRVLARDPSRAGAFAGRAEIVQGDLADPQSLARALAGVDKLYLVSGTHGGCDPDLEANAIDAAEATGVRHVVKLSVIGAEAPRDTFAEWHARSEARLRSSRLTWTMLRPHFFMSNSLRWADAIRSQGAFFQPTGEGRWAAIDPADIGAVAVAALTQRGHEGQVYDLSGPQSLSGAEYAVKLAAAIGKPVRFIDAPPAATRDGLLRSGMPSLNADALMNLFAAMKAGKLDFVSDGVRKATGRDAATFDEWARRNVAAFL